MMGELCIEGCCICNEVLLIIIYNSNCAKDDNMAIALNGQQLAIIDNSQNKCTGRIFCAVIGATDGQPPSRNNVNGIICNCEGDSFENTIIFPSDFLVDGNNILFIESINDANNGNFGTVKIGCYSWDDDSGLWVEKKNIKNSSYSHAEGPGKMTVVEFIYPPQP